MFLTRKIPKHASPAYSLPEAEAAEAVEAVAEAVEAVVAAEAVVAEAVEAASLEAAGVAVAAAVCHGELAAGARSEPAPNFDPPTTRWLASLDGAQIREARLAAGLSFSDVRAFSAPQREVDQLGDERHPAVTSSHHRSAPSWASGSGSSISN
jgi:hypothetical protein